jgi:hypothetical protein
VAAAAAVEPAADTAYAPPLKAPARAPKPAPAASSFSIAIFLDGHGFPRLNDLLQAPRLSVLNRAIQLTLYAVVVYFFQTFTVLLPTVMPNVVSCDHDRCGTLTPKLICRYVDYEVTAPQPDVRFFQVYSGPRACISGIAANAFAVVYIESLMSQNGIAAVPKGFPAVRQNTLYHSQLTATALLLQRLDLHRLDNRVENSNGHGVYARSLRFKLAL